MALIEVEVKAYDLQSSKFDFCSLTLFKISLAICHGCETVKYLVGNIKKIRVSLPYFVYRTQIESATAGSRRACTGHVTVCCLEAWPYKGHFSLSGDLPSDLYRLTSLISSVRTVNMSPWYVSPDPLWSWDAHGLLIVRNINISHKEPLNITPSRNLLIKNVALHTTNNPHGYTQVKYSLTGIGAQATTICTLNFQVCGDCIITRLLRFIFALVSTVLYWNWAGS